MKESKKYFVMVRLKAGGQWRKVSGPYKSKLRAANAIEKSDLFWNPLYDFGIKTIIEKSFVEEWT